LSTSVEPFQLHSDAQPEAEFSAESLLELAGRLVKPGDKILRLRSDKAGPQLAESLRNTGAQVEDTIIYDNERINYNELPGFDAVFFASASGVESFLDQWGPDALKGKTVCVIGKPTAEALKMQGLEPDIIAREATVPEAINALAEFFVSCILTG
jgi:uroporphyrinogen-III synthase